MSNSSSTQSPVTDFKTAVHEWIQTQNRMKELQQQQREYKKKMLRLEFFISTYMKDHEKEYCTVGENDTLVLQKKRVTSGLKKNHIISILQELTNNDTHTEEMTRRLYNMREIKEKNIIKLI
jgi:DNA repair ATPase RecN